MKTLISCPLKAHPFKFVAFAGLLTILAPSAILAQGPQGKSFGFGIILGTPLGATVKLWTASDQAFVGDIGASYFGPLRVQADYIWHFDVFHSSIVKMYSGPGLALAFGQAEPHGPFYDNRFFDDEPGATHLGVGARVIVGLNIIPRRTPVEIFAELGPLIAFVPNVGVGLDGGIGIRFYP